MRDVSPEVYLVARPAIDWAEVERYLAAVGGTEWRERIAALGDRPDGESLIEFMGRMCYRSWAPGLNPNVTQVRRDSAAYLLNVLASGHGSVLEHATYSFVFHNVSRVFTHELVRHRAGTAVSQESLRYVRLTDIPFEHPAFVRDDPALLEAANDLLERTEAFLRLATEKTGITEDGMPFHRKKEITSAMRRYVPDGVATSIGWSANIRAIRHTIELRTHPSAEEEMRRVFDQVAQIMVKEVPALFADFERDEDGTWRTPHHKV
jgi:thymidylate synthase (FAD)